MASPRPIGVFDSGIGGLTVVHELIRQLPHESIVYFGDTARVPYGPKSPDTVRRYSREIAAFLTEQGVKAIVIACNTATAHALGTLRSEFTSAGDRRRRARRARCRSGDTDGPHRRHRNGWVRSSPARTSARSAR